MKKILCPIDFSDSSENGLEYAARLAQLLEASLTLIYVRMSIWPEAVQLKHELRESNEDIHSRLDFIANEVHNDFNVPCHFHFESTTLTFDEVMADYSAHADLIVMGTNGSDNYYQYVMGSNSLHVIEKSKCPVLIIPENFSFRSVKFIVYAYDPDANPIFWIDQLTKLAKSLGARVEVLHVAKDKPSARVEQKMKILRGSVTARTDTGVLWNFDTQYADEVADALNKFMQDNQADMLALSHHHRSLMENLFKENTIRKISMIADYPVLVL